MWLAGGVELKWWSFRFACPFPRLRSRNVSVTALITERREPGGCPVCNVSKMAHAPRSLSLMLYARRLAPCACCCLLAAMQPPRWRATLAVRLKRWPCFNRGWTTTWPPEELSFRLRPDLEVVTIATNRGLTLASSGLSLASFAGKKNSRPALQVRDIESNSWFTSRPCKDQNVTCRPDCSSIEGFWFFGMSSRQIPKATRLPTAAAEGLCKH